MPERTIDEICNVQSVHASRMANSELVIGDVTFIIRPLTMAMVYYSQSAPDYFLKGVEQARLAIADVKGIDVDWEDVELIGGKKIRAVTLDWFADLSPDVIQRIRVKIGKINNLSNGEVNKLDFMSAVSSKLPL